MNLFYRNRTTRSTWTALTSAMLAVVLSLSLLVPQVQAETSSSASDNEKPVTLNTESATAFLDEFFASPETKPHYVGASVVVVKDGQVLTEKDTAMPIWSKKHLSIQRTPLFVSPLSPKPLQPLQSCSLWSKTRLT